MAKLNNKIIIISGPSGVGKSTVVRQLLRQRDDLVKVITCTTRKPRPGEEHGRDYYFISQDEFMGRIKAGDFLEYAQVHGHYYGTLRSELDRILQTGQQPVLVIDVQGAEIIRSKINRQKLKLIFILPESKDELLERIRQRAGRISREELELRLKNAVQEMRAAKEYDYQIVNETNQLNKTVKLISQAIDAEE